MAFDTETTGLNPVGARLVELSGVKFRADGSEISTFQSLIDPKSPIPKEVTAIHGITDEMVRGEKTYEEVVPAFIRWAAAADEQQSPGLHNQAILMAHNAPFDIAFIEVALCRMALPMPENLVLDTLPMARQLISGPHNYQLRTLVEHLGIEAPTYHRALADSYSVRNLFLRMLQELPEGATVETLLEISGRLHFLDRSQIDSDNRWSSHPEYILIKQAIETGLDLRISYSGMRKTERVVTPRSVLMTGGTPYLSAFCHKVAAERTFRIDRIIRMEALDRQ